jgi:hypothetical protein
MTYKTYAQMKAKIERDWDLEEEEMIPDTELMELFNDAISEAEAIMVRLGVNDDYFLTKTLLSLTSGSADVTAPTTIYANKIRKIVYNDGTKVYEIRRLKGPDMFLEVAHAANSTTSDPYYKYFIRNDSSSGNKIQLVPASTITNSTYATCWHVRSATRMTTSASICDIPESYNFIYAHVSWRVLGKDGDPRAAAANQEREKQKQLMIETLETMVDDGDNEIVPDVTHYDEMS